MSRGGKIYDEFTDLPIPGYRKKQLRWRRDGLCTSCGEPAMPSRQKGVAGGTSDFCLKHRIAKRERRRAVNHHSRRNQKAWSYRLEKATCN